MSELPPMILGITGHPASGKDVVADYLTKKYGFFNFSTSDFIRNYVRENNLGEPTRPLLHKIGNSLRKKYGPDYFIREGLKQKTDYLMISGLRNIEDARTLKKAGGKVIAIDVPLRLRYERSQNRLRVGDRVTFEQFKNEQEEESNSPNPNGLHVNSVIEMADYVIDNDGTIEDLYLKIDNLLIELSKDLAKEKKK